MNNGKSLWTKAIEWHTKAANQNNDHVNYNLGCIYFNGKGVEVNYQLALQYYQIAANQGHPNSQIELAIMHHRGLGVEKDSGKAIHFFSSIPDKNGDVWAILGEIYHSADTQFLDFRKALECYEQTDGENKSYALRGLGLLHEHGDYVNKDYKKALEYYTLSRYRGNKGAYYNIALLYYYGKGVPQDFFASFEYFEQILEGSFEESNTYVLVESGTDQNESSDQEKRKYSLVPKILYTVKHTFISAS